MAPAVEEVMSECSQAASCARDGLFLAGVQLPLGGQRARRRRGGAGERARWVDVTAKAAVEVEVQVKVKVACEHGPWFSPTHQHHHPAANQLV